MDTLDDGIKLDSLKIKFRWMLIGKLSCVLANIIFILYLVKMAGYTERIDQGDESAVYAFESSLGLFLILSFLVIGTLVLGIVMTCLWVYRAGYNLHLLEMPDLQYTPGWYVGWFFIPLAWWVMPFFTMREIAKASASMNNKANWKNAPVPVILVVWYVLFLGNSAYSIYTRWANNEPEITGDPLLAFAKQLPELIVPTIIGLGLYILVHTPSVLFAWKVTKQQHEFMEH